MYKSVALLKADLGAGKVNCVQLVQHYLERIEASKHLNVFLEVYAAEALAQAQQVQQKIDSGTAGRLAGVVLGLKDVLCHKNHGLQASSKILDGFKSQFTATAIQRLLDEDAIVIGRQNCDEFAMGSSNENSAFGATLNHADNTRVPGGSSGASAVAVQAGLCHASIGSDTGGSVRQPGAFCGVVGYKPTYSRISRYGLIAYASSFDSIGPITQNVEDAALLLEIMAGPDEFDSTVSQKEVPSYTQLLGQEQGKKKIAYLRDGLESKAIAPQIRQAMQTLINGLQEEGHSLEAIDFPMLDYILPTYYILTMAEASSNLSRYDGIRYGYRSPLATDLASVYKKTRSEGFGKEVKRRIMLGTFVLSASYYDAYFTKAQRVRRLIKEKTDALLEQYDFLLMPTTPATAFKLNEKNTDPLAMFLGDIFTVQANVCGVPAVSLPAGNDENGLPIGLQLMSKAFSDAELLSFANYVSNKGSFVNQIA